MIIYTRYTFIWGWKKVLGSRANYRKKDGQRLSATEYKKRRQKEIALHLGVLIAVFITLITASIVIIYKVTHREKPPVQEEIVVENATEEISIIDTVIEEVEEEQESAYLQKSEDSSAFFEGYSIQSDSDTAYISSEGVYSNYGLLINLDTGKVVASKEVMYASIPRL